MARSAQKRRKTARADVPRRRPVTAPPVAEDTMFFPRLRRQAKWMFVFLALVFGVGFVVFGVGSNAPSGLGDVLNFGAAGTGQPSVSDAREKIADNPNNAAAYRELATALEADGRPEEAITALEQYVERRPRDADALRRLAGLHSARANRMREEAELAQLEAQAYDPGNFLRQPLPSNSPDARKFGESLQKNRLTETFLTRINERVTAAYTRMQTAYGEAKNAYAKAAAAAPDDPQLQLQLADAAQVSGDMPTALAAYRRFLRLAPDDPLAPSVRAQLQQLRATAAQAAPR